MPEGNDQLLMLKRLPKLRYLDGGEIEAYGGVQVNQLPLQVLRGSAYSLR